MRQNDNKAVIMALYVSVVRNVGRVIICFGPLKNENSNQNKIQKTQYFLNCSRQKCNTPEANDCFVLQSARFSKMHHVKRDSSVVTGFLSFFATTHRHIHTPTTPFLVVEGNRFHLIARKNLF
jgi:Tfp pilus tip-associated adhesin PilY1